MPQSLAVNDTHAIFSTKNRQPFLADTALRQSFHAGLADITRRLKCPAIIVGGVADHVHILANIHRTVAIAAWMQEVKRVSSQWAKEQSGLPNAFAWQNGYAAFSVSGSHVDAVRDYIANQEEHHRHVSFQEEYRAFLKKHGVEWDEQYMWE